MCEVTFEMDLEEAKEDTSTEPLPEPLLIILSPPPPFLSAPGKSTMLWPKWLKAFEHYIQALGEKELAESSKLVLLQNSLGQEGERIFTTLIQSETTYAATISKLTEHFSSDHTSQVHRLNFHQRAQMPGETIDQFVSALGELLRPCNYGHVKERLLLDQLMAKTNSVQLRERLLVRKETLTLSSALAVAKELESVSNDSQLFDYHEVSVDIGDDFEPPVPIKRRRGRPRRGEEKNKTKPQVIKTQTKSSRLKEEFYYSNDKLYYSDGEAKPQATGQNDLDCNKVAGDDNSILSASLKTEDEDSEKTSDYFQKDDSDDEDFGRPSTKPNAFRCRICINKHFKNADRLARHMRMHTNEKPFTCPVCSKTFSQSYHMTRHMRNQHAVGQYICPTCGESQGSIAKLKRHETTHKSQVLFCPDCNEKFTNNDELCSHFKSHRTDPSPQTEGPNDQQADGTEVTSEEVLDTGADSEMSALMEDENSGFRYVKDEQSKKSTSQTQTKYRFCPICVDRPFRGQNKLARHMRTHTKEKPFVCPVCSKTFSQSYHMTRHIRNQHAAGQYICPTCGESHGSVTELQRHKTTHKSQILFCPDCNEKFTNNDELCSHFKSHRTDPSPQNEGPNDQQTDGTEVKDKGTPEAHADSPDADSNSEESEVLLTEDKNSEVQSDEDGSKTKKKAMSNSKTKGHFCPICVGRRFRGPTKLARHMRTHTKEKPFVCPVCSKTFSQSYHMTRHVRDQHSLGQHICSKCGKSFGTWLELKAHKKTHAVEGLTCLACDKQFKGKAALAMHLKLHRKVQSNPRSLKCTDCDKEFGRMYHLKRHIMSHRKAANSDCYTCPDCQKNFFFPEDFNKHLEVHAKESNGTCPKCDETFSTAEDLETHMAVHRKTYSCSICGKKFKVEYALKKHEQSHQHEQYYCSLCRKHFLKLSHYKRHVKVHDRRETKCPHCDGIFLKLTALKYHLRTHTEERPYQCSCCIETFEEKEDLDKHCLKHKKFKKERPYSCTRCDCAYSTLVELTEHMSSHEGEQPQTCPVCGKTFLNKNKLERHLTIHTGERPHLCSICGNGFPSAASLKLHIHIHTGEKPFQCSQCSKSFRSSSGLRLHSRQHMDERPSYECPECGRTYGRMTELKMHQRYHTGDKPYSCTCCNKRFISKDKLNVHMRTHTGERPFSCPHCGQSFTQTGDRNRHISKYHPLPENTTSESP